MATTSYRSGGGGATKKYPAPNTGPTVKINAPTGGNSVSKPKMPKLNYTPNFGAPGGAPKTSVPSSPIVPAAPGSSGDARNIGGASAVNNATSQPAGRGMMEGSSQYPGHRDPVNGVAGNYLSGQLGTLFSQPGILAEDVLNSMGLGTNRQMLGQFGYATQYAPALAELLTNMTGNTSQEAGVNTMADYLRQMATKGGMVPDANLLLQGIVNPLKGSDLYDMLNAVDPNTGLPISASDQFSIMKPYLQAAMSFTTPLHQNAQMAALQTALANFQGQVARGGNPGGSSFYDYLRQNGILG